MNKTGKWIIVAAALFYVAFIFGTSFKINDIRYFTLIDDAMISMRYAQNLAQGHGLVWNIGEKPVEGFTNLGWTLYMAFLHLIPFPAPIISLAVMLTCAAILLGNIIVVHGITQTLLPDSRYAPTLAALITAFYFPLVFWSLRGMEVGLLTLLIDAALLLAISKYRPVLISLLLMSIVFVRLDALLPAALIGIYFVSKHRSLASTAPLVFLCVMVLAILYFQQSYFGDYLPTTYYQKVTGYPILDRARRGMLVFNEFATRDTLALFLLSTAALFLYRQQRNRDCLLLLGIFGAQCVYSIYLGGDYAEPETNAANRFITQGMPALIILFSLMTSRILSDLATARPNSALSSPRMNPAVPLALIVVLVVSGEPWFSYAIGNAPLLKADIRRVKLGLHIAGNTSPEAIIAVHAAGRIPYFSQRTTIDLLGLNDPLVSRGPGHGEFYPGHNKWNYEYSIGVLQPDLIADNFAPLGDYISGNENYQQLDNEIYVRIDSSLINIEGLSVEYK